MSIISFPVLASFILTMNVQSFPSLHTYRKKDQNLTKHKYIHAVEKNKPFPRQLLW